MTNSKSVEGLSAENRVLVDRFFKEGSLGAAATGTMFGRLNAMLNAARSTPPVGWVLVDRAVLEDLRDGPNGQGPRVRAVASQILAKTDAVAARPLMEGLDQGSLQAAPVRQDTLPETIERVARAIMDADDRASAEAEGAANGYAPAISDWAVFLATNAIEAIGANPTLMEGDL